jgi:hypothetical protein
VNHSTIHLPLPLLLKNVLCLATLPLLLVLTPQVHAQNYLEAYVTDYDGLLGKNIFGQRSLSDKLTVTFNAYKDDFYQSTYVGLSTTALVSELELGLGLGQAKVNDGVSTERDMAYNPWLWFQKNGFEAFAEAEVLQDDAKNYYYRAYLHHDISDYFYVGYYTERDVGGGPLAGIKFEGDSAGLRFFGTKPSFNQPSDPAERSDYVVYAMGWVEF